MRSSDLWAVDGCLRATLCVLLLALANGAVAQSSDALIGPSSKRAALLETPDEVYDFIVRGSVLALAQARALAAHSVDGAPITELPGIDGLAARLKVSDAVKLRTEPGVTQVWYTHPSLAATYVHTLQAIEYAIKNLPPPGVINMSLGPPVDAMPIEGEDEEPMNVATKMAADKGLLAIIAIGNYYAGDNTGMVNPWCRPNWVVCVAAATSDMRSVWPGSARGVANDPRSWPDVAADGVDVVGPWPTNLTKSEAQAAYDEAHADRFFGIPVAERGHFTLKTGTSQATAEVSRAAAQIMHFVSSLLASKTDLRRGAPLFALEIPKDQFNHPARAARLAGEVTARTADTVEVTYGFVEPWKLVKQLLLDTAVPIPGSQPQDVGAGFVSPDYIDQQFGNFGRSKTQVMPIRALP